MMKDVMKNDNNVLLKVQNVILEPKFSTNVNNVGTIQKKL